MLPTNSAHSETAQTYKSRCLQPIIYTRLSTSTLVNHQRLKRIKGLLGYSEQFKDNYKAYEPSRCRIKSFRSRDYRKARELDLEIFAVDSRIKYLERSLKVQRNLRIIRIRFLSLKNCISDIRKPLCEVFGKMSRINRIQVDFSPRKAESKDKSLLERVKATRKLPNLKEIAITQDNEEIYRVSVPLFQAGFDTDEYGICNTSVKDYVTMKKLMKKTCKFEKTDTIRLRSKRIGDFSEEVFEALALVISKLPNLREFSIEFATFSGPISIKQTLKILDTLLKVPSLEILKFKILFYAEQLKSIITHPAFKAKSLKRVHLSLFSNSEGTDLAQEVQLLREIPMLYELSWSLCCRKPDEEITGGMAEIAKIANLRKLQLDFVPYKGLNEEQAEEVLHSLSRMSLLEELVLWLRTDGTISDENQIAQPNLKDETKELPRLQKVKLIKREDNYSSDKIMVRMAEFFGKCSRLREMEFDMEDCRINSWEGLSRKLMESWGKLKHLQTVKLNLKTKIEQNENNKERIEMITVPMFADWMRVFDGIESLQDIDIWKHSYFQNEDEYDVYENLQEEALRNPKYRFFEIDDYYNE